MYEETRNPRLADLGFLDDACSQRCDSANEVVDCLSSAELVRDRWQGLCGGYWPAPLIPGSVVDESIVE